MKKFTITLSFVLLASAALAQVTTDPAHPQAGEPFELVLSGVWGDSCVPAAHRLLIDDRTIHVTYGRSGGGCLSVLTAFTAIVDVPPLAAGTYEVRARLIGYGPPEPFFERTIEVAGEPSGIESIAPSFDTSAGNRVVVLRGSFPCASSCPPQVFFGAKEAEGVEWISENEIHAVAPAQTNVRTVDVTVRGSGYTHVRPSGFTYVSRSDYEIVLVPVITRDPVPGGHGSLWQTELHLVNRTATELEPGVDVFPLDPRCASCVAPIPARQMVEPRFAWPHPEAQRPPAQLFYVNTDLDAHLAFNLRVRDLSRQAESWGTELPVVRESDLSTLVTLVDVPMQPRFRQKLRLYMPDYVGCCQARVRFHSAAGEELATIDLNLDRANGTIGGLVPDPYLRAGSREFPLQPGYAEIDLWTIPELAGHETIWVTAESRWPPSRIWAFVSITNDETQQVTTVTPQ